MVENCGHCTKTKVTAFPSLFPWGLLAKKKNHQWTFSAIYRLHDGHLDVMLVSFEHFSAQHNYWPRKVKYGANFQLPYFFCSLRSI